MMTRRAMAWIAAFAAAISVGALGYAVVWAFDFAELARPVVEEPPPPPQETRQPAPRRRALVIVAPRVAGEDVREAASSAPHAAPPGETLAATPTAAPDQLSALVAVAPAPTPRTPGEDGPPMAASSRVTAASAAADRPLSDDTAARSELIPQSEAKAPPAQPAPPAQAPAPPAQAPFPPDPEPTGGVGAPTVFRIKPHPIRRPSPRPAHRAPEDALTPPGITIIRGVPPVPADSPGIVRPGPLIIHVPPARR
jgi:hypothetical protein